MRHGIKRKTVPADSRAAAGTAGKCQNRPREYGRALYKRRDETGRFFRRLRGSGGYSPAMINFTACLRLLFIRLYRLPLCEHALGLCIALAPVIPEIDDEPPDDRRIYSRFRIACRDLSLPCELAVSNTYAPAPRLGLKPLRRSLVLTSASSLREEFSLPRRELSNTPKPLSDFGMEGMVPPYEMW
jgi:hypothetical protein